MTGLTPQQQTLNKAGWKEVSRNNWVHPKSTMHNPVPTETALKIQKIIDGWGEK